MSKKTPQIRFKGFTDDWEERKLGDITKISTGKLDANAMVENGKYDFYTSGIKKYRIDVAAFEGPSITIAGNGATVGYMHLADNKFNAYQRTYVLQEFLVDRSFIFSEIGNKLPKKIKQEARTGNIPYIVMDMLTELKLSIPQNNSEQQKIGSFFKQLDDTIDLHQRKLDLLKEQKKGFLQKMFPKNGSRVPELRFSGFADDWEERKLTDVTSSYSGLTYSPTDVQDKGTFVLRSSNVKNDQLVDADNVYVNPDIVNSNNVKVGDVIVVVRNGSRSLIGKHAIVIKEMPNTVIGAFMSAFRGQNGDYINALLSTNNFQKEVHKSLGATINQITGKDFSMMNFLTPKLEEQRKIGSFFKQLDETIALHQRKLDLLKEQKKGFLQKMFVS
ncbi:restriction endonuclease subunit S [Leuconostoc mesenteroides]|uniref:restriction endonuclease subunit S n=1 Tax=Leuconostoc mesenteroides TaxID=1245 RepID=UPI001CBCF6F3|nr:restriction endonuclease subunit S [Leuconostoc mesenteroides]MBZ1529993.1 restriction endonuclease subunit S [Leuconostoc mesenteroides]MBZ1540997.1 restriction endonuclease subunit S [Leuconostoc mesenteroides]